MGFSESCLWLTISSIDIVIAVSLRCPSTTRPQRVVEVQGPRSRTASIDVGFMASVVNGWDFRKVVYGWLLALSI